MDEPTDTPMLYLKAGIYTVLALFGLGIGLWAAFFLIEGLVAFTGGSLLEHELIATPFTFLLFMAMAFTFGQIYLAPLAVLTIALFWSLSQFLGESRLLAIGASILISWAAGIRIYLNDIQNMPGQSPFPAVVLFTLIGVIAGSIFWAAFSSARDRYQSGQ
ncbi:hypothetical protein O2N63_07030 [Aliiroseovarius sp. KMU-50]|uniref:Uncharacterized protein n=1 Tax=Aliiroseovarius salicola TaxID=3009082 RepID=A0ABT4VZZ1_9RHOB|nr:hypothetical protein [Aliiroseovarius sp. KMU-50]MDA5093836.1 hypothetical protein [Aliiroseovarius sp. KMU-50]